MKIIDKKSGHFEGTWTPLARAASGSDLGQLEFATEMAIASYRDLQPGITPGECARLNALVRELLLTHGGIMRVVQWQSSARLHRRWWAWLRRRAWSRRASRELDARGVVFRSLTVPHPEERGTYAALWALAVNLFWRHAWFVVYMEGGSATVEELHHYTIGEWATLTMEKYV